jgi:hypothetical protein
MQSTVVTKGVPALFSTECMDFAPTTFRIKTNYFRKRDFSLFQRIRTGFWSHPARYSVDTETASPGDYPLIRSRCYKQADDPWLCREMNPGLAFLSQSLHWLSCLDLLHIYTSLPRHCKYVTSQSSQLTVEYVTMAHSSAVSSKLHFTGCWKVLSPTRKETSCSDRRFWFSYILFIIIIGGILVIYTHIYIYI